MAALADNAISRSEATDLKRIKKYLNDNIGKQFTINNDGSVIDYTEYDRNEFLYSKYSRRIGKKAPGILRAKNRIVSDFGDVVSVARNPSYQENYNGKVHQGDPDIGQKGFTHYDVTFGIPVKDNKGNISDYKLYDGELVIEHNANGKSTLYDIINIKNSHRELGDLTPMGGATENESTHRSDYSSGNNISNSQEDVNNSVQDNNNVDMFGESNTETSSNHNNYADKNSGNSSLIKPVLISRGTGRQIPLSEIMSQIFRNMLIMEDKIMKKVIVCHSASSSQRRAQMALPLSMIISQITGILSMIPIMMPHRLKGATVHQYYLDYQHYLDQLLLLIIMSQIMEMLSMVVSNIPLEWMINHCKDLNKYHQTLLTAK